MDWRYGLIRMFFVARVGPIVWFSHVCDGILIRWQSFLAAMDPNDSVQDFHVITFLREGIKNVKPWPCEIQRRLWASLASLPHCLQIVEKALQCTAELKQKSSRHPASDILNNDTGDWHNRQRTPARHHINQRHPPWPSPRGFGGGSEKTALPKRGTDRNI